MSLRKISQRLFRRVLSLMLEALNAPPSLNLAAPPVAVFCKPSVCHSCKGCSAVPFCTMLKNGVSYGLTRVIRSIRSSRLIAPAIVPNSPVQPILDVAKAICSYCLRLYAPASPFQILHERAADSFGGAEVAVRLPGSGLHGLLPQFREFRRASLNV